GGELELEGALLAHERLALGVRLREGVSDDRRLHPREGVGAHERGEEEADAGARDEAAGRDRARDPGALPRSHNRSTARSFALRALGFRAISSSVGAIARRVTSLHSAAPQVQTGIPGGQRHGWTSAAKPCFTARSSSEWKEIAAALPPRAITSGSEAIHASSAPSSSFTAIRSDWK